MRLIDVKAFLEFHAGKARRNAQLLVEFNGPDLANAAYAILSHCWGQPKDEVQYTEMESLTKTDVAVRREIRKRSGYQKILKSCLQARDDRLDWLWVDTCCIDKRSSAELSEAINSMYVWYANSDRCYAYLHDMGANTLPTKPDNNKFAKFNGWPKWFSRGWTLQELIAPEDVHFFNRNWEFVTRKRKCARTLKVITRISVDALEKGLSWSYPSVAQIMSWAADRRTTREEDRAYSLLGLFGVYMPLLYGEGKNAFLRLQLEVIRMTNDQSIFAWGWTRNAGMAHSFLANDPSHFRDCSSVIRMSPSDFMVALEKSSSRKLRELASAEERFQTFTVTNHGIEIWLPLKHESCSGDSEFFSAILACCDARAQSGPVTIIIEQFRSNRSRYFGRPSVAETQMIPIEFKPILLPYRDNINLNIRGPSSKQSRFRVLVEDIIPSDSVVLYVQSADPSRDIFIPFIDSVLGNTGSGRSNVVHQ
ncbi:heterokaryon incompatibility protein-domain-containing protein [Pisolithus orientalis]|uniref:heterokaryon incompatibility protein-domain-containing protein n=1 Tax=Pisolithus orientalis TaxID=936130 RepID=UPI002224DD00|nr:heterokaryon incompatibility protein-domain-containing protein [Pisolithus orientalis]KAI5993088.1 heterokaryon incompatibility protein-domain-containing protein [Pisolithus orientalis]